MCRAQLSNQEFRKQPNTARRTGLVRRPYYGLRNWAARTPPRQPRCGERSVAASSDRADSDLKEHSQQRVAEDVLPSNVQSVAGSARVVFWLSGERLVHRSGSVSIRKRKTPSILNAILEVPIEDLADNHENVPLFLADLLASKKDLSFQDMQSIGRAFDECFDLKIDRDAMVNDIVLGQACRHSIVHAGGRVDRRLVAQLRATKPRSVKPELRVGEVLEFSPSEIRTISDSMKSYLQRLNDGVYPPATSPGVVAERRRLR
jgi:hypothetical protein